MKVTSLIGQLQAWQSLHGDVDVLFSQHVGDTEEHAVNGMVVAEDEDGGKGIVLFTKLGVSLEQAN